MGGPLEVDGMSLGGMILRPPSAATAVDRLLLLERLGYGTGLLTHINEHDSLAIAAATATRTGRLALGTAVVPIYSREPAAMAQTAATIAELSGNTFALGVGLSHGPVAESWFGTRIERPVDEMREYVARMRFTLEGTPVEGVGERWGGAMPLAGIGEAQVRIHIGALSPGMLRLAGEVADGVVLWACAPEYLESTVVPSVREGRRNVGKDLEGFEIVPSIPTAVTDEPPVLRRALALQSLHNLRLPFYRRVLERSGFSAELALLPEASGLGEVFARVDDEVLDQLAEGPMVRALGAIGSPQEVYAKLSEYRRAGATLGAVSPIMIRRFEEAVTAVAGAIEMTGSSR